MARQSLNVLVLSDFTGKDANVVRDYLYCFNQHSKHQFFYLHSWSKNQCRRLRGFDFNRFDAIILFWDFFWIGCDDPLSYCYVPDWVSGRIADSTALKIQFLQDEYRDVRAANRVMSRFGVNLMFSCVAPKDQGLFYPKSLIPSLVATYPVLTGYVPSYLEKINCPASIDREIDIGYRSRKLPYYLGQLGQEKSYIAERFQQIANRYGFSADISVLEKDRIYGEDWLAFMRACRFSLGTESGASVVDFDGSIRKRCFAYLHDHPDASFEEVERAIFPDADGKVVVQTISPRIFEAAAFENTLILHEGHYEGMLEPDKHYISMRKDYANVPEVVERMKDRGFCERLGRNAKARLIDSKEFSYASFVRNFDGILESHVGSGRRAQTVSRTLFYMMNYLNNDRIIPRGGVCLSVPHTCDVVYHYNNNVPYLMVLWASISLIIDFVCQSPSLVVRIMGNVLRQTERRNVSLAGILKDLRVVALFLQMRSGLRSRRSPPFELHLSWNRDSKELVATSVPWPSSEVVDERQESLRLADEKRVVEELVRAGVSFTIRWENHQLGSALPLRSRGYGSYCIDLDEDCVYHFQHVNGLQWSIATEEEELLSKLLFGSWREPSLIKKAGVIAYLCGAAGYYLMVEKPLRYLGRLLNRVVPTRQNETGATEAGMVAGRR